MLFFIASCSKPELTEAILNYKQVAQFKADSITTIISDSGIIRYRISAPYWDVYDRADTPYWDFPEGLHFERFNEDYDIDAQIDCQRAVYYSDLEIWKLNDNVIAVNLKGEQFETEELYWEQKTERVYSDSSVTIKQTDKIINGIGFSSNQTFTKYEIRHPYGIIPVDSEEDK
jgi:LPS export ABC transporter protein LptC